MDNSCYPEKICYHKSSKKNLFFKVFLSALIILLSNNLFAQQQTTVTVSVTNESMQSVFDKVEKNTIYRFTYMDVILPNDKNITISASDMKIEDFLNKILSSTTLAYKRNGNTFSITQKSQDTGSLVELTGIVVDEKDEPLIGVIVAIKNTTEAATTGMDGKFALTASPNAVLKINYLGYFSQEIKVEANKDIRIRLIENTQTLDEVVVVGYGMQKKSDLTGSIASVKGDALPKLGATTLAQTLKGQIPGLSFSQTSNQPGAAVWMQIRGAAAGASPLIVVDGIPVSTMWEPDARLNFGKGDKESILDNINPDDIQDIQVLKDASATSIYGSRAAGGVILITTKRGTESGRTNVSLKTSYTGQRIAEKPKVMSGKDYMLASNASLLERWVKDQGYYPWGDKSLPEYNELARLYEASGKKWNYNPSAIDNFIRGTDWYDAVTRDGQIQQYDLSLTGDNKNSAYLISLGYMGNDGIVKNNDYDRITGRINFDQTFSKWLKAGIGVSYSRINSNDVPISGASGSTTLFQAARKYDPTIPVRDENGNYALGTIYGLAQNPASILDVTMYTKKDNFLSSAYLDVKPFDDLVVRGTVGYDRKFANTGVYFPSTTQEGIYAGGIAKINENNLSNYYVNVTATYSKIFAQYHSLKFMAGWEFQKLESEGFSADNQGFPYDGAKWHNLGLGTYERPNVSSFYSTTENASFISRLNYSFKDRYLLTANFRRDGSSNFAPNKQWGNFGGVALAWRINEEEFMNKFEWLSNLKLRAGAGITGYAGSLTGTQTYYTAGKDYYFNNKHTSGVALAMVGNPNLSWESQEDINIGLDLGLFNGHLGATVDVYERTIKDRIGTKNLMSYHEVNTLNYNTKRIDKTQGIDLSIYGVLVNKNSFSWTSQFTLTYYKDKTTKRDPSEILDINNEYRYTWNDMWYYSADGLVQPGEAISYMPGAIAGIVKIRDVNGYLYDAAGNIVCDEDGRPEYSGEPDGKIDKADLIKIGNNTPIPFSWSNTFNYKNFDLNIYLYGKLNNWKNNDYKANLSYGPFEGTNAIQYFGERYTFDNLDSKVPAFTQNTNSTLGYGDYFMEKAWFIRLENISLGYTLPKNITKRICQSMRFYGALKNVAVLTPYNGQDPEYDIYMYPSTSAFTFGIDIKF
ncbi:MAG: TonB-dependent receptor [Dysgonamonadaceae bacterium]|nr:TonB-dependent receptor [Dysgonamonadaceae bacterium]